MSIRNAFFKFNITPTSVFGRWLSFTYLIGIILAPVVFLTISISGWHNMPWYFVLITSVLLLSSVVFGVVKFKQERNQAEEISISPANQ